MTRSLAPREDMPDSLTVAHRGAVPRECKSLTRRLHNVVFMRARKLRR